MFLLIHFTHLTRNLDWWWCISTLMYGRPCGLHASLHWHIKLNYPATFGWSACTKSRCWVVMYICVRYFDCSSDSTIDWALYLSRQWGIFFLHYIANDTSEMNTSVTGIGIIKQCWDYNYKCLYTRVNWLCFASCNSEMCNEAPVRILN